MYCTSFVERCKLSMYGVYHGPDGIRNIGKKIHSLTSKLGKV